MFLCVEACVLNTKHVVMCPMGCFFSSSFDLSLYFLLCFVWVLCEHLALFLVLQLLRLPLPRPLINLLLLLSFIHGCARAEIVSTDVSGCTGVSLTVCLPPALQVSQPPGPSIGDSVGKHVCRPGLLEVSIHFCRVARCVCSCVQAFVCYTYM